jgi:hypothetical protein
MSTVVLDTITGKSTATTITIGSTPVVSASANSMTIRGEGSNQTSIQQGLAKHWVKFPPSATAADSFNNASITDNGTGDFTLTRTNDFGSANYSTQINGDTTNGSDAGLTSHFASNQNLTASVTRCIFLRSTDFAAYDTDGMCATLQGDLA